jgi:hypothetical protein
VIHILVFVAFIAAVVLFVNELIPVAPPWEDDGDA